MRLSVTDIDSFRWYQKLEYMTADEMRARLLRQTEPSPQMAIGTAWHEILENPPGEILQEIQSADYTFRIECDEEIVLPKLREIKTVKTFNVEGQEVSLVGKVDGIDGNVVTDHKLSFRPNLENYFEAMQWRAYLLMFNATAFRYYIYHAKQKENVITITGVQEMKFYLYPGIEKDLQQALGELVAFIKSHVPEFNKL